MRNMEQIESFNCLSIGCREDSHAPSRSCSELTRMLENEAREPTPGSPPSSIKSSPIMTPETSDDEDEDVLQLPEAALDEGERPHSQAMFGQVGYGSNNYLPIRSLAPLEKPDEEREELYIPQTALGNWNEEDKAMPDLPAATSEQFDDSGIDVLQTSVATIKSHGDENEDFHRSLGVAQDDWEVEGENALEQDLVGSESSHDEGNEFHDALMSHELYYGVLLSSIRKADREELERINATTMKGQPRSRIRILRELKSVHKDETVPYLSVVPIDGNIRNCLACMEGAPDTPYQGGIFWLHIDFPEDYPLKPPVITFLTPVYHPNIDETGRICIDILEKAWSPCLQTHTLLLSILSVLHSPIVDGDTLVPEIAEKYLLDNDDFCDIVRVYTANANGLRPDTSNLINLTPIDSSESQHEIVEWPTQTSSANH